MNEHLYNSQLPIGKGPDLDATKEGGTADQSIFNSDF